MNSNAHLSGNPTVPRMNFLVQAAKSLVEYAPETSRKLANEAKEVAHKSAIKLDHTVKRQICKGCHAVLCPGINCTYRIRKKKHKKDFPVQVLTCSNCTTVRRLPLGKGFKRKFQEGNIVSSRPTMKKSK